MAVSLGVPAASYPAVGLWPWLISVVTVLLWWQPRLLTLERRVSSVSRSGGSHSEAEEEEEEEEVLEMAPTCRLDDNMLPLDAASIKRKQVCCADPVLGDPVLR